MNAQKNQMKSKGVIGAFMTVSGWTLFSRFLGFFREMLLSRLIGAAGTPLADAFLTAFRLPNFFRRFLGEGAFNAGFIPVFSKTLVEDEAEAKRFAQNAFSSLAAFALILIIIVQIFPSAFVLMLSPGYAGDMRLELASSMSQVTIFYILFMSLVALLSAVLNGYSQFWQAAAAPAILNVVFCSVLGYLLLTGGRAIEEMTIWLSWTIFIGGLLQFLMLYISVRRLGIKLRLQRPRWNSQMTRLVKLAFPALIANGVNQLNLLVGTWIASPIIGASAWLYYSDRFYQLPLGMIGIALGVVLLPLLSRYVQNQQEQEAKTSYNDALIYALFFTLPAMTVFIVFAEPLVRALYEGAAFTYRDSVFTAQALMIYAFGLPASVLSKCYIPIFYARENAQIVMRGAVYSLIVNIVIAFSLLPVLSFYSAVLSSSISAWVLVIYLYVKSQIYGTAVQIEMRTIRAISGITIASVVMGIALFFVNTNFHEIIGGGLRAWLFVLPILALAGAIYLVLVLLLNSWRVQDFRKFLKR